ncbi:hypothetical protein [Rhodococcoides fascians]|uniref:hypothetical protein n=1 Tax=Rhodococcoides fascians TaxID=1828 RepID=UPI00050CB9FF|nr:hypothetical protein [Rhodococcus fascians]
MHTDEPQALNHEQTVRETLADVYYPAGINLWLAVPNPKLPGSLSPTEAIDAGLGDRVVRLAAALAQGGMG